MNISIRARLTIWFIGTISIIFIAFALYTYINFSHAIYGSDVVEKFDSELIKIIKNMAAQISERHGPFYYDIESYRSGFSRWIGKDLFLGPAYGQMRDLPKSYNEKPVLLIKNMDLMDRLIPLSRNAYSKILNNEVYIETLDNVFDFPIRVVSIGASDMDGQRYILQLGMSMKHINTTKGNIIIKFLIIWPVVLIIISGIGYIFVKKSFAPVKKIVKIAKNITAEDLSQRIESLESNDEIGDLIDTFNDMIRRLERSFEQAKQFSDDVSHELKTPITIIKGEIEVALRSSRTKEEYIIALESLLEETGKLESIIDNLLVLSRIDSFQVKFPFREIELAKVIMEAYEDTCTIAANKNLTFSLNRLDEINVKGNADLLKRLFVNLMTNAMKYTADGGRIDIELIGPGDHDSQEIPEARFSISDTGIGIPGKALPHIFDRFYRVDKSRSLKTGGAGLGLTIVKKIMELHKGRIRITSTVGKGTTFFLFFPNINKF